MNRQRFDATVYVDRSLRHPRGAPPVPRPEERARDGRRVREFANDLHFRESTDWWIESDAALTDVARLLGTERRQADLSRGCRIAQHILKDVVAENHSTDAIQCIGEPLQ